ncbi:GNAT family N-acetyltransferase [Lactiplantibacillus plantarum]|uniref:GNAT family N-acetyltransferase n=1 Tax=Lactiplantibacillus plantarum TaxID=1590 RepID=UPI004045CC60
MFAVARDAAGVAVGCGAMVLAADLGEIKRMYTLPSQRGQGVASGLLRFLESESGKRGVTSFALETGCRQPEAIAQLMPLGRVRCTDPPTLTVVASATSASIMPYSTSRFFLYRSMVSPRRSLAPTSRPRTEPDALNGVDRSISPR